MSQTSQSSDVKKPLNSKPANDSQQIAWHRTTQPEPTSQHRYWLIFATVLLAAWLVALAILARLS